VKGTVRHFRRRRLDPEEGKACAARLLAIPILEREPRAPDLHLDDPETVLALVGLLAAQLESRPAAILEEAAFLYRFLEALQVEHPRDPILYDEREYFLGESARIAGTAARFLARRNDAKHWFDLAELWFGVTENAGANLARLAYQRLVLRVEERDFEGALLLLPRLIVNCETFGMAEDALKCRFLQAGVLKETDQLPKAAAAFRQIADQARTIGSTALLSGAYVNLVQIHGLLGNEDEVKKLAEEAAPLLRLLANHGALAKFQWGVGYLFRQKGRVPEAIKAFREAQYAFSKVGMQADVAAVHLILADLLLDAGQAPQAEWEIRAALPIIDEYRLVPESIAALSLLRQSLQRRQIDRQALRSLHGYFRNE
jgi:tetratricopeptide (TPR) repeat protein